MGPEKRRPVPLGLKLAVALSQLEDAMRALGSISPDSETVEWELDHFPMLAVRPHDEVTGHHIPHQHSIHHLVWMPKAAHALKTTGRRGESDLSIRDGDQARAAKVKRIRRKSVEFQFALLQKDACELNGPKLKSKSQIKSRVRPKAKPQRRASGYRRKGV